MGSVTALAIALQGGWRVNTPAPIVTPRGESKTFRYLADVPWA